MFGVPLELIKFQSTLPLRGATHYHYKGPLWPGISIHAPLTGSDSLSATCCLRWTNFNPRSPYGERQLAGAKCFGLINFNPRSPYGERRLPVYIVLPRRQFQSTLPLRGATKILKKVLFSEVFQSTLPLRGATGRRQKGGGNPPDFNPRSPYGERPVVITIISAPVLFQSTLPLRGATFANKSKWIIADISIHAPLTGSDEEEVSNLFPVRISIHAPLTGSDACHMRPTHP